jgi:hypothetical protein
LAHRWLNVRIFNFYLFAVESTQNKNYHKIRLNILINNPAARDGVSNGKF